MKYRSCRLIPPQQHHLVKQIQDELRINHADALRKGQINTLITTSQSHRLRRSIYHTSTDTHIPHQNVERKDFLDTYYLHRKAHKTTGSIIIEFSSKLMFFFLIWSTNFVYRNFHISRHFSLYIAILSTTQAKGSFYAEKKIYLTTIGHR